MHYTAVEDLFLREETISNAVCPVKGNKSAAEVAALTSSEVATGDVYKLTTTGYIGSSAYRKDSFVKATVSGVSVTWAEAAATDIIGYKESEIRDWKRWGRDHSKDLGIAAWAVNGASLGAGAATVILETSANQEDWTEIASAAGSASGIDKDGRLAFFLLPRTGIKQFVRVKVKVTDTFGSASEVIAPVLTVGLENDAEQDIDATMIQPKIG